MALQLNLYCRPADVYDLLGTQAGQLLQDDSHMATGQQIIVSAPGNVNDTTLTITPLRFPILAGTVLEFSGANLGSFIEITVTAPAARGAMSLSVPPLLPTSLTIPPSTLAIPQYAEAEDNGVNLAYAQRLIKACQYGTTQVKLYCSGRYEDSDMLLNVSENGSCNRWSTNLAARWIFSRRGLSVPKGLAELVKETMDELKKVMIGTLQIEDIGTRTSGWPFISNVTLDLGYDYRKIRVETPLSEATPVFYPQSVDWNSALWVEI